MRILILLLFPLFSYSQLNIGILESSRNAIDPNAQLFITAAGITNSTQKTAINDLVIGLKADGLWTKMKAIYPFVGGTATTHKFNLKDPRDLDAAYRLLFVGGWTHSSTGAKGDGVSGYANTYLNENTEMTLNDEHISVYSRTNTDGLFCDIGVTNDASPLIESNIFSKYINAFYPRINNTNAGIANTISSTGLFISNRVSSTEIRASQNNVLKIISSNSISKVNRNYYLLALSSPTANASLYSPRELAFTTIGSGLTDAEMSNLYTRVQAFQTALSRQL